MPALESAVLVGMAEIQVIRGRGQLTCLGLGSCIGLCGFDPSGIAGMVHIMLPEEFNSKGVERPGKFADTGIPALLNQLENAGASRDRLDFAMAGGAQVFKFGAASATRMDIGGRNIQATHRAIQNLGLKLVAEDTGGNSGRTVIFDIESGIYAVRTVTGGDRALCNLRG